MKEPSGAVSGEVEAAVAESTQDSLDFDENVLRSDPARREHAYRAVLALRDSGVLREIGAAVDVEVAAFGRETRPRELVPCVAAGAELVRGMRDLALNLDALLAEVQRPRLGGHEAIWLAAFVRFRDGLRRAAQEMWALQYVAGIGGGGVVRVQSVSYPSGIEAALKLAFWLFRGVTVPLADPFFELRVPISSRRCPRPPQGRPEPRTEAELDQEDRLVLLAVRADMHGPKEIRTWVNERSSKKLEPWLVRKRKKDLVAWGLLEHRARGWFLTAKGREWLKGCRAPKLCRAESR